MLPTQLASHPPPVAFPTPPQPQRTTLDDKYLLTSGRIYLSGIQALARLPLLQRWRDQAAGLNTAGFISGYRGSPLGGLDEALWKAQPHLAQHHIKFQPGVNEDLAATSVWSSQQVDLIGPSRYDGVFGLWYGKGPGVDRSADVLKHGNHAATSQHGGVLLVAGDDHGAYSSTLPHQSDHIFSACMIPMLHPCNVQEYIELGLHGWPLEPDGVREFSRGLKKVLVVEEKRQMVEYQLKEQLYNWREDVRPRVIGTFDDKGEWVHPRGEWLLTSKAHFSVAQLARVIAQRIARFHQSDLIKARLAFLEAKELLCNPDGSVRGVATGHLGIGKNGLPTSHFQPGIELHAKYTLFAEGSRGQLGKQLIQRYALDAGSAPQSYAIGLKELWEVSGAQHQPGRVVHTAGWPLDGKTYGRSFPYHLDQQKVVLGFVDGLDYSNPWLRPFEEFQRWKTHPAIRSTLRGGKRLAYGEGPYSRRSATAKGRVMLQIYVRDNGAVTCELAIPLHVAGKRWGASRFALDPSKL